MWEFILIISTLASMSLIPVLIRVAEPLGLMDRPSERKVHAHAVPRVGGIAIVVSSLLPLLYWLPPTDQWLSLLLGVSVLSVSAFWDDRKALGYRAKFASQVAAAVIVVMGGGVLIERVPFVTGWTLPAFVAAPFTVFVVVGITNAINLSDGLDGLAGGTSLLALGAIALMAFFAQDYGLTACTVAIFGGLLGFLRYNSYPARVFMGDMGSQFLGFALACLAIILTQRSNTAISPMVPILLLGFPILDTLAVMAQRAREGRPVFAPDKNHMHHKLLATGFDHYEAVVLIYGAQALLVTLAFTLRYNSDALLFWIYALFCGVVIVGFQSAAARNWRVASATERQSLVDEAMHSLRDKSWPGRVAGFPRLFVSAVVPALLLLGAIACDYVSRDIGVLALVMFIVLVLAMKVNSDSTVGLWAERIAVYVSIAISAYFLEVHSGWLSEQGVAVNVVFIGLALALIGVIRFADKMDFRLSPLDFLVIFAVLMIPAMPDFAIQAEDLGAIAFKFLVLCYGAEMLLSRGLRSRVALRIGVFGCLAVVAVRGIV